MIRTAAAVRHWGRKALSTTTTTTRTTLRYHHHATMTSMAGLRPLVVVGSNDSGKGPFRLMGQQHRGLRYHERGWWEDGADKGVVPAPAYMKDADLAKGVFSYVSDRRKEEIYRLHLLAPDIFDITVLSYLFSISKARVEAIIKEELFNPESKRKGVVALLKAELQRLKADEVEQRKTGRLYTKCDKVEAGKQDPCDLVVVDEENMQETMEDLNCPPLATSPQHDDQLKILALVQAAKTGTFTDLSSFDLDPELLEATIKQLDDKIGQLTQEREAAINAEQEWEEKDMDQMTGTPNMFKRDERINASILEDPDFLYFNAVLGMEIRRVQLIKDYYRATQDSAATPYEKDEAKRMLEQYGRDRQAISDHLVTLRLLPYQQPPPPPATEEGEKKEEDKGKKKEAGAKGDEKKKEGGEEEVMDPAVKETVRKVRKELSRLGLAKIVTVEQLEGEVDSLMKEVHRIQEQQRRSTLVQALRESDKAKRSSLLQSYLSYLLTEVGSERAHQIGAVHEGIKWEVFQEFRRGLHHSKEAFKGLKQDPNHYYLLLEDEVDELINQEWSSLSTSTTTSPSATTMDMVVKEEDGVKRKELIRDVVKDIIASFDVPSLVDREVGEVEVGDPVMVVAVDVHHSSLHGVVDVLLLAQELKGLLVDMAGDEVVKSRVGKALEEWVVSGGKGEKGEKGRIEEARKQLLGLMTAVREQRVEGLKCLNVGGLDGDKEERHRLLKEYLGRLFLEVRLQIFDQHNRQAMSRVMGRLQKSFKSEAGLQKIKRYVMRMIYYGEDLTANDRKAIAKLDWDKDPEHIDADFLDRLVTAMRSEIIQQAHGGRMPVRDMASTMSRIALDDFLQAGVEDMDRRRRVVRGLREVMGVGVMKQEDMAPLEEKFGQTLPVERIREAGLLAFAVTPMLSDPRDDHHIMRGKMSDLERRINQAKEMLDHLRGDEDYQSYVAQIPDDIVEEIEKELLDHVLYMSDELRTELDPELKDLKEKGHYDVPSLRFRVINDKEYAVGTYADEGFSKEDEQDAHDHLHPKHAPRQYHALQELSTPNTKGKQRWQLAFKDISQGVKSPTVVREGPSGRLRVATTDEESKRSWLKRRSRIDWNNPAWRD